MFAIFLTEGMNPFYQNIASFPTVIFTFFLALCALYWIVAVLGLVSIDILDFDLPEADGAGQAASNTNHDVLAGLMLRFGLQGVPVTIIISFIALFGWLISYYAMHFAGQFLSGGFVRFLVGLPVLFMALFTSTLLTAQIIKPLRPLFRNAQQQTIKYIIGQTAIVRTSVVDKTFGEATLEDGGAGLILKVRTMSDQTFKKGDRIVLLEYLKEADIYHVISESEFLNK